LLFVEYNRKVSAANHTQVCPACTGCCLLCHCCTVDVNSVA